MESYKSLVIRVLFFQVLSCHAMVKEQDDCNNLNDLGATWTRARGKFLVLKKLEAVHKETITECDNVTAVKKKKKKTTLLKKPSQSLPLAQINEEKDQEKLSPRSMRKVRESDNLFMLAQALVVKNVTPAGKVKRFPCSKSSQDSLSKPETPSKGLQVVALPPISSLAPAPYSSPGDGDDLS